MTQADRFTTPPHKKGLYNFAFPAADGMVIVFGPLIVRTMLQHSVEGARASAQVVSLDTATPITERQSKHCFSSPII